LCSKFSKKKIRLTEREATKLLLTGMGREKGLDSSDGEKDHGNQPAEKDDIDEESFHIIFIGICASKVKSFLVYGDSWLFVSPLSIRLSTRQTANLRPLMHQENKKTKGQSTQINRNY